MQKDHGESPVVTNDVEPLSNLAQLTVEIVSAYVSNNEIAPFELGGLITTVAGQLSKVGAEPDQPASEKPEPAVSVRRSIRPDHLICLVCGKPQKMLKRHLAIRHELTPAGYRERFRAQGRLPDDCAKLRPAAAGSGAGQWPGAAEETAPAQVDRAAEGA
jgi:predicted transcriptional regulator